MAKVGPVGPVACRSYGNHRKSAGNQITSGAKSIETIGHMIRSSLSIYLSIYLLTSCSVAANT